MEMSIAENLKKIRSVVEKTASVHACRAKDVEIIAVSKTQSPERIQEALEAGQRVFGENRVQEAQTRWINLRPIYSDLMLHLIGPLQTNKVKEAVKLFDVIQTLDREKLAHALSEEMHKQNRVLPCFIQINTGEEEQKAGVAPKDAAAFLKLCRETYKLNITGLMCIPPVDAPPALHFALLKKMAAEFELPHLSMGMSSDFDKAIALGATHIRIGTAIFGERI